MNLIQDGAKEITIASVSSAIGMYTGIYWLILVGIMVGLALWAINTKQRQRRKLDREAKKDFFRWERRTRKSFLT